MPSAAPASQGPAIRPFQMDSISLGQLANSVNLFRGDVTLTQPLFTLPGRTDDQGLDVTVALSYQSNVVRAAQTWNRDQPTGVAGLGFGLGLTCIELDDGDSPVPGLWSYSYSQGGQRNQLIREPSPPFLFALPADVAAPSDTASLIAAFAANGIALSAGSTVTPRTDGTGYDIADDERRQLFQLVTAADGSLQAFDGGQSFQLTNYAFWKILYYPPYERWVVVTDSGQVQSFGGDAGTLSDGRRTSLGNSIVWGVRWTTAAGTPLWAGSSSLTDGQAQFPCAWYLESLRNIWGDAVTYAYNEFDPAPETGLIPGCEQRVGSDAGRIYTKAIYLTRITDVFGRRAVFSYGQKLWQGTGPDDIREYADPHKAVPDDSPNAYQDRYETRYLSGIAVTDAAGGPLFSVDLVYRPRPDVEGDAAAVANVTPQATSPNPGDLLGDTYKRYLTAIVMRNAGGEALPGILFHYCLTPIGADGSVPDGESPGALASVTYPQGGIATYRYARQSLTQCDRRQDVTPPVGADGTTYGGIPRCWFGDDYAVTCWYDVGAGQLTLQVYSWVGNWLLWQPDAGQPLIFQDLYGLDLTTLDVAAGSDHFALFFETTDGSDLYLFRKDVGRPGQWTQAPRTAGAATGLNAPTLSWDTPLPQILAGTDFLLCVSMSETGGPCGYQRITWNWESRSWAFETPGDVTGYAYVAAGADYYVTLDAATGVLVLTHLDGRLAWVRSQTTVTLSSAGFPVDSYDAVALVAGSSMVAVSWLRADSPNVTDYSVQLVQWDGTYTLQPPAGPFELSDLQDPDSGLRTGWVPTIVADSMVAVGGNLLRFNGQSWLANSNLAPATMPVPLQQRYAYGPDYALLVTVRSDGQSEPTASVLAFDPNTDSAGGAWTTAPSAPGCSLSVPPARGMTANWPSAGPDDYLAIGPYLYFRGTLSNWQDVVRLAPLADLQALADQAAGGDGATILNTQSLIDEAPDFLACCLYDTDDSTVAHAAAVLLKNGRVAGKAEMLAGQRLPMPGDSGAAGPGQTAAGPGAFIAYPDSATSFSDAESFTLYRYAGDAFQGPVEHFAVAQLTLTDGFGGPPWSSLYVQDIATAACDPTGDVVKYYKTTVYPGTDDIGDAVYGRVEATYLNGLQLGENVTTRSWSMMDGLQQSLSAYDAGGVLLAQTSYGWTVMTQRALSPDAAADPVNLYGGYVLKTSQQRVIDGVPCTTTTAYVPDGLKAPFSGQPVYTATTSWDGQGREVTLATTTLYGYEVADAFRTLNILDAQAQTTSGRAPGGGDTAQTPANSTVTQAQATVFRSWPSALGPGVMVPAEAAQYSWTGGLPASFPFAGFDPVTSRPPAGWIPAGFTTARSPSGMVLETADAAGTVSATLFDTLTALPAAQVTNASFVKGQCAFWSPSPNVAGGFTATGTALRSGDGHLGDSCLELPAGSGATVTAGLTASVTATVTPVPGTGSYLLGFWYKTAPGFQPADGAGWTVTAGATARTLPFTDTEGVWIYRTLGIPVPDGASVTVTATNTAAAAVRLDAMFVQPLVADLEATVYDPRYDLELASMDAAGRTRRNIYDRFQQQIVEVDPCEATVKLNQGFASRRGNADGIFDPASPNALVTVEPAGGGTTVRFLADGDWQAHWQPGGGSWTAAGGLLTHTAGPAATLDWRGWGDTTPASAALLVEWVPANPVSDGPLAGPVAITFGDGWVLSYDPQPGVGYELAGNGVAQPPLARPPDMAGSWLLVMGRERILFFADGQLLFSQAAQPGDLDAIRLSSGPNALSIRSLSLVAEPRLTVLYQDAAGRSRQSQHLLGDDAIVSATIHDALNRVVASTKSAPASFGADPGYQPMAYQPRFIDVYAFLAALRNSWRLDGALSDYYAGQGAGMQQRSDDQGYPYHGTRHPAGAAKRPVELGLPGKPYAIHDIDTTSPTDRQTVQYAYGPNTAGGALPAGRYGCKTVTTPLKSVATVVTNTSGDQIAATLCGKDGGDAASSNAYADYAADAGDAGRNATVNLPNCQTPGPQSGFLSYSAETLTDPLGRIVRKADPSSGTTLYIYDACGRLRFVQPPLDPGAVYFVYHRYDALGRLLEQGTVDQPWDQVALQVAAEDAAWPGTDVPHTPWLTLRYDGDGDEPTEIGQKIETVAVNPAPTGDPDAGTVTVTERFTYDGAGRVAGVTQSVSGTIQAEGTISYGYNALGDVVSILYPAGSPLAQAVYGYDERGKVVTIGSSPGAPDDIAAFTYTCDGEVATVARNRGRLQASLRYGSPGWVEALEIRSNGAQPALFAATYGYDAQGSVTGRRITFPTVGPAGTEYDTAYRYDGQRRLVAAPGTETIDLYDSNGNIWAATLDGTRDSYTLAFGSDRLAAATLGGAETGFTYAADGWLTTGDGLTLEHSAAFQLTTRVASDRGAAVRFAYGSQGQRAVQQLRGGTGGAGVSYSGIGRVPLLAVGADGTPVATVAGPDGVLALVSPDGPLFPLTDIQGTVWGAVDDQDRLAAWYNFGPFGEPLSAQGPAAARIGYTFLGQRLDAATGLYHFDSRLYAPRLRRFLSPDPAGQFPSPYIFVGNDPVSMTDSDGAMAGWAQALLDGLTIAALVVGAVLTDGADTPALIAASEGMADEEAASGALDVAKAAGKAAEDAPGKRTPKPMSRSEFFARRTGATAIKGAVGGAKSYAKDSGQNFNAKGLFESIAIGATAGAVRGALGGVVDLPAFAPGKGGKVAGKAAKYAARYAAKGIATAIGNEVSQMLTNAQQHEPWSQNMAKTAIAGFVSGAGLGAAGDASKVLNEKYGPQIEQFKAKAKAGAGTAARGIGTALCGTASALSASYQTSSLLKDLSTGAMVGGGA